MNKNKKLFATFAALFAQIIFGFSFMFTKIAIGYKDPMIVIADRYLVAFVGLSIAMIFTKTKIKLNKGIWKLLLMSIFQPLLYFIFETFGIKMTTSTFSSIMISMIPVVSMVCGIFVLKEIPSLMQYIFTAISVIGVVIMTLVGNREGTVTPLGVILLIGAVLSSVFYNAMSRKISGEFSALERTYAMTLIGMVSFVAISLAQNIESPISIVNGFLEREYTVAILYLAIFSSVIAFLLLNYANTHLPITKTTVFSNITTVVSVFAGVVFLEEKLTIATFISVIMIIAGVFGVQMFATKKK